MDTCNILLAEALSVFSGPSGINDQIVALSPTLSLPAVGSIFNVSAPVEVYEKTATVKYPVVTIRCERLKNLQTEKFRMFSGTALLVVEIRVSGARAEELDANLNSYVQATCQVLDASRGAWTDIGTYAGAYDVKFQAVRLGGKQFIKSAQIEFEIQISK